jgi:uncharacterized protein (DUF1499 family)
MRILQALSLGGFACLPIGALGTRVGLWRPGTGLAVFGIGTIVVLSCGLIGAIILIVRRNRDPARSNAAELATVAAVFLLLVLFPFVRSGLTTPPIHQVSTDLVDPPSFRAILGIRGPDANPVVLDPDMVAAQIEHYPWIRTLVVPRGADASYETALQVIEEHMVLEVVNADPIQRIIEATDTSFWFGFKDDMVVRVRFGEDGTQLDVRSISRYGGGDLGVNADRVGEFFTRFLRESGLDTQPAGVP